VLATARRLARHSRPSHRLPACGCSRSLPGSAQHRATPSADVRPSGTRGMRLPSCQRSQAGTRPGSQHPARSQPYSRREAAPRRPHARPQGTRWPPSDPHSGGTACQRCAVHRELPSPRTNPGARSQPGTPSTGPDMPRPASASSPGSNPGRIVCRPQAGRELVAQVTAVIGPPNQTRIRVQEPPGSGAARHHLRDHARQRPMNNIGPASGGSNRAPAQESPS
jgi:hypothetical protein